MSDDLKKFDLLGFGEVMIRLSPIGKERISQSELFEKKAGGSELNVIAGASLLGMRTGLVTKLPKNEIGEFVRNRIRLYGIQDDAVLDDYQKNARLGIYYYESGAYPRKPCVVYDRAHSSIQSITFEEIPEPLYGGTEIFHTSGISMALGETVQSTLVRMMERFKEKGAKLSFDVNYRANLWDEKTAKAAIARILPMVDILFVSEESSRRMFGKSGSLHEIMKSYCAEYGISVVATTERKVISPTKHTFGSTLYSHETNQFYTEEPYRDIEVIDRIGSGDAYVSGVLTGLLKLHDYQKAVEIGNAMSALKNTVSGDLPATNLNEIANIMESHKSTGIQDEMKR
jgi:Sugar kinases, ribokinase family